MAVNINCPTVGNFRADGTAKMEVVYMQTVALDTPDREFNVAADPFTYFTLAEEASGSTVGYTVSVNNVPGLKTLVGGWLKGGATDANSANVETYMIEYLRGEINALVSTDGVGAALEAHVIKNLAFTQYATDAQNGANTLVDDLCGNQNDLNAIGLQFPAARYPETFSSSLPAISGDSLTVQFTISSSIVVSDSQQDPSSSTNAVSGNPTIGASLNVNKSRIVHLIATKA
jgi:hypothetical protein